MQFMKVFFLYSEGVFSQHEFLLLVTDFLGGNADDLITQLRAIASSRDQHRRTHNVLCKPISEHDTSKFEKVSPSYYKLPNNISRPICTARDDLCRAVLNNDYTSLPHGSESFKFKPKNINEEQLFKIEDEMYQCDNLLHNNAKTLEVFKQEFERIQKLTPEEQEQ